jgi:protein TonB
MLDDPNEKPLPPDFRTTTNDSTIDGIFAIDPLGDTNEPLGRDLFSERAPADGDAVPLVRISPDYPEGALRRGLEGRVLLEFTIGRSGAVENARVIAAEPNSIFNAAALKAVRQWRYNPKIKNGVAVEQPGIRIAIPFRREEPGR